MSDSLYARLQHALAPKFTLERELQGGGMSRVFVAMEEALARRVVIKVLPPDLAAGVNTDRFRREIQLAAQLHHPHIVPLLAAGEVEGLLYYTMPFIEGESLREQLTARRQFSPRTVVRMLHDIVDALAYAHRRGIVHRDIKPGNILTLGSHALVTDFGVAKALSVALPMSGLTTGGVAVGSPAYMAPEQLAGDPTADHRMDIYAVGLLAYELLAGESPFSGPSPQATMAAQLTRIPEPIDRIRGDVPPALAAILTRCLQKNPSARYASADELLAALDEVEISSGATATRAVATRPRRVPIWVAAVALVGAAGAGMAANWLMRSGDAPPPPVAADSVANDAVPPVVLVDTLARTAAAQPRVITRAESLAIARSVRSQIEAEAAPPRGAPRNPVEAERFTAEIERMVRDSVRRALEAMRQVRVAVTPPPPPVPRPAGQTAGSAPHPIAEGAAGARQLLEVVEGKSLVAIEELANTTARAELGEVVRQLSDSLRVAIDRHPQFLLVPRVASSVRVGNATAEANVPGYTVSGLVFVQQDRLTQMLRIADEHGRVVGIINGPVTELDRPLAGARELVDMLLAQLDRIRSGTARRGPLVSTSPSRTRRP